MSQTLSAGQSVVGIQQYLQSFRERWEVLTNVIHDRKQTLEFSEKKKVFVEETQRILIMITEIITYVEKIVMELKHNPKELLIKIEVSDCGCFYFYGIDSTTVLELGFDFLLPCPFFMIKISLLFDFSDQIKRAHLL